MRVVGGELRGRALAAPETDAIRPTSDRARQALFNIIEHRHPGRLAGARVFDLFAGTGALGIEALSRGAAHCLFVEDAADARALIRRNVEALGLAGRTRIYRRDATTLGAAGTISPFDLVFADPPYGRHLAEKALEAALRGGWLAPGVLCVVEEAATARFSPGDAFVIADERSYGDTVLRFLELA